MAYTVIPQAQPAQMIDAAYLNTYLRDNLAAEAVGLAVAAGDLFYGTGLLALARRAVSSGRAGDYLGVSGGVPTFETPSSLAQVSGLSVTTSELPGDTAVQDADGHVRLFAATLASGAYLVVAVVTIDYRTNNTATRLAVGTPPGGYGPIYGITQSNGPSLRSHLLSGFALLSGTADVGIWARCFGTASGGAVYTNERDLVGGATRIVAVRLGDYP